MKGVKERTKKTLVKNHLVNRYLGVESGTKTPWTGFRYNRITQEFRWDTLNLKFLMEVTRVNVYFFDSTDRKFTKGVLVC